MSGPAELEAAREFRRVVEGAARGFAAAWSALPRDVAWNHALARALERAERGVDADGYEEEMPDPPLVGQVVDVFSEPVVRALGGCRVDASNAAHEAEALDRLAASFAGLASTLPSFAPGLAAGLSEEEWEGAASQHLRKAKRGLDGIREAWLELSYLRGTEKVVLRPGRADGLPLFAPAEAPAMGAADTFVRVPLFGEGNMSPLVGAQAARAWSAGLEAVASALAPLPGEPERPRWRSSDTTHRVELSLGKDGVSITPARPSSGWTPGFL